MNGGAVQLGSWKIECMDTITCAPGGTALDIPWWNLRLKHHRFKKGYVVLKQTQTSSMEEEIMEIQRKGPIGASPSLSLVCSSCKEIANQ